MSDTPKSARRPTVLAVVDVEDKSSGIVLKKGILRKRGKLTKRVRWIKRYFVLQDNVLKQFDAPERIIKVSWKVLEESQEWVSKKTLDVSDATVAPVPGVQFGFSIHTPNGGEKIFKAGDPVEFQDWITKLLQASSLRVDHSRRRDSILRQPTLHDELAQMEKAAAASAAAASSASASAAPKTKTKMPDRSALLEQIQKGKRLDSRTVMRVAGMIPVRLPPAHNELLQEVKDSARLREESPGRRRPSAATSTVSEPGIAGVERRHSVGGDQLESAPLSPIGSPPPPAPRNRLSAPIKRQLSEEVSLRQKVMAIPPLELDKVRSPPQPATSAAAAEPALSPSPPQPEKPKPATPEADPYRSKLLTSKELEALSLMPADAPSAGPPPPPSRPLTEADIEQLASALPLRGHEKGAREYYEDTAADTLGDLSWNERFQACIEEMQSFDSATSELHRAEVMMRLINLATDFNAAALSFGKIIINELYLDPSQKTIKPLSDDPSGRVNGMAGGEKYVVHNLYFKFCRDDKAMYGSDWIAAKVGGHELKGAINLFHVITWAVKGLCLPMMALIDYRGFRLICESLLPINKQTIVYGSSDAGATVHLKDREFSRKMKQAAKILHLEKRKVREGNLYSAVDVEGHLGKDGRHYVIDLARAFPPETPKPGLTRPHLYRLLRPEFVMLWEKSLCPDAYSGFVGGATDAEKLNEAIDEATQFLLVHVIPAFAAELTQDVVEQAALGVHALMQYPLAQRVHRRGINLRYLGLIRAHCTEKTTRGLLLVEMIARVQKALLNARLRKKQEELGRRHAIAVEQPFRLFCVDFFNLSLGNSPSSEDFWNGTLLQAVALKFDEALSPKDREPGMMKAQVNSYLPSMGGKLMLFKRLQRLTGVHFSSKAGRDLERHPEHWSGPNPFDITDLKRVGERVKHMQVVNYALGYLYMMRGRKLTEGLDSDRPLARRFFLLAREKFEEGLDQHPNDCMMLCHSGEVGLRLTLLDNPSLAALQKNTRALVDIEAYFVRALSVNSIDPYVRLQYAQFLEVIGRFREAEDNYIIALEVDPNSLSALREYSRFLNLQGQPVAAQRFAQRLEDNLRVVAKTRLQDSSPAGTGAAGETDDLRSLLATRRNASSGKDPRYSFSQPLLPFEPQLASTPSTGQLQPPLVPPPPPMPTAAEKGKGRLHTKFSGFLSATSLQQVWNVARAAEVMTSTAPSTSQAAAAPAASAPGPPAHATPASTELGPASAPPAISLLAATATESEKKKSADSNPAPDRPTSKRHQVSRRKYNSLETRDHEHATTIVRSGTVVEIQEDPPSDKEKGAPHKSRSFRRHGSSSKKKHHHQSVSTSNVPNPTGAPLP